jgi:hypothetical protein
LRLHRGDLGAEQLDVGATESSADLATASANAGLT